jgi:2-oxoglutarate ferredoxin oxidoreductase subunit alpha
MEDELAASITLQGAVWGGAKALQSSSGPGFTDDGSTSDTPLTTETPCVFVDVQRGGPSTWFANVTRAGRHDAGAGVPTATTKSLYPLPNSPQECFDLTITASISEGIRVRP